MFSSFLLCLVLPLTLSLWPAVDKAAMFVTFAELEQFTLTRGHWVHEQVLEVSLVFC